MKILALDLGKFKSVACCFDVEPNTTEYWTLSTDRSYLAKVLQHYQPKLVAIEACSIAAWVHDLCRELGYDILVCNPNQAAWAPAWYGPVRRLQRLCTVAGFSACLRSAKAGAGDKSNHRYEHASCPIAGRHGAPEEVRQPLC